MKIGFIGLGHMGTPMALNLLKAGMQVTAYDVVSEAVTTLVKSGAKAAQTIKEAAANQDVVITMVQTGKQVSDICRGEDGIFKHIHKSALYIDCSSIDMATAKQVHAVAEKMGLAMLDAPVSGGVAGATAASLTIMVGGSQANFKRAEPVLQTLGKKIIHAGTSGTGQAAKICNNMLLAISMIGVSEAFMLADKLGLDQKKFFDISSNASGQCWSMTSYCPVPNIIENVPANHHYQPGFMAKMMLKDLRLAQHAAASVDAAIPLGGMATELYELFVKQGYGDMDFSGIIKLLNAEEG
jgi:3-hydroxyisobutyrate dehydrogenase